MKKIVFTEEFCAPQNLFPFTLTRQIQDIRVGILTIREKWEMLLGLPSFDKYESDYKDLERTIHLDGQIGEDLVFLIHGNILPTAALAKKVARLKPGECLSLPSGESIAYCISSNEIQAPNKLKVSRSVAYKEEVKVIRFAWDIFRLNAWAINADFDLLTSGRSGARPGATNKVVNKGSVFVEKGASISHCFLNPADGPVYIGKNAVVMEGSMLRGPVSIGEGAVVKMGTKIYGATTIGPGCTVGGEIKNAVFFANSNKAHDGYVGDSVIGEWCNMGAGTSNSNVKNNASGIQIWTPQGPIDAGIKCGFFMGDYSRTAINTSINTGTVIGASAHVAGNGLTPKYIPSFSWGSEGIQRYQFEKALADINNWKQLKGQSLTETERTILKHIFDHY